MKRLGLVLAGGGALGAYQFGVLQELREQGLRFEVVSGTSVGALNAALWAYGRMNEGAEFWGAISLDRVYPPRARFWRLLPVRWHHYALCARLFICIAYAVLTRSALAPRVERLRVPLALFNSVVLAGTIAIVFGLAEPSAHHVLSSATTAFGSAALLFVIQSGEFGANRGCHYLGRILLGLIVLVLLATFNGNVLPLKISLVVTSVIGAAVWLGRRALLDSEPLARSIETILGGAERGCRAFATVAYEVDLFDPATSWFERDTPQIGPGWTDLSDAVVMHSPRTESRWIARYVELPESASARTTRDALLASAALPFGVVRAREVEGIACVDGGVADNVPIAPVALCDLDEIVVVTLEPIVSRESSVREWRAQIARRERDLSLSALPVPKGISARSKDLERLLESDEAFLALRRVPLAQEGPALPEVRIISPDSELGGFFDGVLRFEADFARELVERGRRDARLALISWEDAYDCS